MHESFYFKHISIDIEFKLDALNTYLNINVGFHKTGNSGIGTNGLQPNELNPFQYSLIMTFGNTLISYSHNLDIKNNNLV